MPRGAASFVVRAGLVTALLGASLSPALAEVRWRSGERSQPAPMERARLARSLTQLSERPDARHVVAYFDGPLDPARRATLEANGVRLLSYLGGHAWFASVLEVLDATAASGVAGFRAVEPIRSRDKLHPDLEAGVIRPWTVVSDERVAVVVLFQADVDAESHAHSLVARHGGEVRSVVRSIHGAVAHIDRDRVADLAAEDAVMYVEPPLPGLEEINSSNRALVGADVLQAPPYGLDGSGVTVMVFDGGRVAGHTDLAGRLTVGDGATVSDHSTHVACTVAGNGAESGGLHRGMAPGAAIVSYGFHDEGALPPGFLYTDPSDLEADYAGAITLHGADLSNNSIGTNTAANGFPCEWEGNYGATGALIDEIARGALGEPFRIVWANGNERSSGACGFGFHTTAPPACAKNHITVGALYSDTEGVASFSSYGPCDDGRLKPDVSAPGCEIFDDAGVTSCSAVGGYSVKCGTSMASPTVAGIAALLLQQHRTSFPATPDLRPATLKAILAQTAQDLLVPGPDYASGYGSVRAVPAVELIAAERFAEGEVGQGVVQPYAIEVPPGAAELTITLAWDDPAGTPNVDPVLVNDLDLRVVDPEGTVHYPWTLDPANPAVPALRTQRDDVNNIEQVTIYAPLPGLHKVEVEGFDVAGGGTQTFGLASGEIIAGCASAATLSTDVSQVTCEGTLLIDLVDCDLNTDDATVESVGVPAVSQSEPAGESVVLSETAPFLGSFGGALPISTADSPGVLQVSHGETIQVSYVDADDGAGGGGVQLTADVFVDCVAPQINDVSTQQVGRHEATVAVTADESVEVTVSYGPDCSLLTGTVVAPDLAAEHAVLVSGLDDGVTYDYAVEVRDQAGNVSIDDNAGDCHTFTTELIPDFLTERFLGGFDLEGMMMTYTPDTSAGGYAVCAEPLAGGLPTDPSGGIDMDLADDVARSFSLDGAAKVKLFGVAYNEIWVGPNGFLTFGEGDNTFEESLDAHFALPRVSGFFDDLHPGKAGAAVVRLQLEDRVAVTWLDVPEAATQNLNTFQIEMFFDGRIRLSWLAMDATDAIVGLSSGIGLDPEYSQTDLSLESGCGPFPPFVRDVSAGTSVATPVSIRLLATDDGLPAPPMLTYRVQSLPTFGTLTDDEEGAPVVVVPADILGDSVSYLPYPGFGGTDTFTFRADDGGSAPEGGESFVGLVTIGVAIGEESTVLELFTDDDDPGWSTTGDWAFGQPSGGGSHGGDPTSGATGANVYGYNLDGDYANDLSPEYLTTPAFDLGNVSGARLEFERWLGVESSLNDHVSVQLSTNGSSWSTVWNHFGPPVSDTSWQTQSLDIAAFADGEPAVSFRWVMGATNASGTYPGWNIDDARIVGTLSPTCSKAPGEAQQLSFEADRRTLHWSYTPAIGEASPRYDTIRASSALDFGGTAVCIEPQGVDTSTEETEEPPAGEAYFYLVRVDGDCGPGPLGGTRSAPSCLP